MLISEKRKEAIRFRQEGKSIREIARLLHLASSTVSLWVRHVVLSHTQKQRLLQKSFDALQQGRKKALRIQKNTRQQKRKKLFRDALKEMGKLSQRDIFIAGVALYWGEGFKKDNRLGFASSDPAMIKLFLRWLSLNGVIQKNVRLRAGINISHKKRAKEIEKYWSKQTGIPLVQFQKPFFQKFKWKKEFPKPEEYFGVLRIRANNQGELFIKIQAWIERLRNVRIT